MSRVIAAFLLVIALAALAAWVADRPGRLGLDWQGYRVEMPVGMGIAIVVALMVAAAALWQLWRWVRRGPAELGHLRARRRRDRGELALTRGMVAVAAGDRTAALRFAREAERYLEESPLTMLLAAQAAQLGGDDKAARRYFAAMLKRPDMEFLGLRGLVGQASRGGDAAQALDLARRAYAINPETPWVLSALFDLEAHAGNWREAERIAARAVTAGSLGESEGRRRQAIARMQVARGLRDGGEAALARKSALQAHALCPGLLPATLLAVDILISAGKRRRALHLVEDAWRAAPHPDLAAAHRRLYADEDARRYRERVLHLTGPEPESPEARLALAEADLAAGDAAAAAARLRTLAEIPDADARALRLMARAEEALHGPAAAKPWLARVADGLQTGWGCSVCGHRQAVWSPHCGHCAAFDALRWETRPPLAALPEPAQTAAHPAPLDDAVAQAETPGMPALAADAPNPAPGDAPPPARAAG